MVLSIETAFIVAILIAVLIFAGYLEWSFARGKMMRRRKTKLAAGAARDDAFNASVTSKAILRNLRSQGYDVSRAEPLLRQSDAELEMGNFTHAKLLADDARQALFEIKSRSAESSAPAAQPKAQAEKAEKAAVKTAPQQAQTLQTQKKLPRNFAEASFTIRSVEMEIAKEEGDENESASLLLAEARKLFEGADYDGALRMAVKASRSLAAGEGDASGIQSIPPPDAEQEGDVCASCGAPLLDGDSFCRKCGSRAGMKCPSCGEPLTEGDTFCGKCGTRISG